MYAGYGCNMPLFRYFYHNEYLSVSMMIDERPDMFEWIGYYNIYEYGYTILHLTMPQYREA